MCGAFWRTRFKDRNASDRLGPQTRGSGSKSRFQRQVPKTRPPTHPASTRSLAMDLGEDPWGEHLPTQASQSPAPALPASLNVTILPDLDFHGNQPERQSAPPEYLFVDEDSPSQQPARLARDAAFSSSSRRNGQSPGENVKLSAQVSGQDLSSSDFGGRHSPPGSPLASPTGSAGFFGGQRGSRGGYAGSDDEASQALSPESRTRSAPGVYRGPRNPDSRDNYDPHTAEFAQESTGRRVAYENFTTIDWIHVSV